jgi:RNA polymerase sigma-70 factor, ECF subfamily
MHPLRARPLDPNRIGEHLDALYRAAWALTGSRHDAEDLVQEAVANVLARPRRIRESELGYLMRAVRNAHADGYRSAARRPVTVELRDTDAPRPPAGGLRAREVMEAIAGAPAPFRDAVVAIDVLGLSYREAAAHLGVPEATVATRVHRGRRQVAQTLLEAPETCLSQSRRAPWARPGPAPPARAAGPRPAVSRPAAAPAGPHSGGNG